MILPPSPRTRARAPLNAFAPHAKGRLKSDFALVSRRKKRGALSVEYGVAAVLAY